VVSLVVDEAEALDAENPWPGLMPFTEAGQSFFHGRDTEITELVQRVRADRVTVLFGQSGLGKTSLLNAGLFPRLRGDDFLPIYLRLEYGRGELPVEQIKQALAKETAEHSIEARLFRPGESLWGYFQERGTEFWDRWNRLVTPVLVFDQFEEIFTRGQDGAELEVLLDELAALTENRAPVSLQREIEADPERAPRYDFGSANYKIALALREEFLPELEDLQRQMPSVMRNRMRLTRMNGIQARDVVLTSGARLVAEGVADRIIAFVAASRSTASDRPLTEADLVRLEIDPALLSIVCRELNTKRLAARQPTITADLLAGAQQEIVAGFYNSSLADLGTAVTTFIEEHLITAEGYRDTRPLAEAIDQGGVSRDAIDRLIERRLLRIEERFGTQWIELTHDLLTEVIRQQRDLRRQQSREAQQAEARAQAERERAEQAEAEARAAEAEARAQKKRAREASERERIAQVSERRTRRALHVTATMLAVTIAALIFAFHKQQQALTAERRQAELARSLQIDERDMRVDARRTREQRTTDQENIKELADNLAGWRPEGATIWPHRQEATALGNLGDHAGAIKQLDQALRLNPDYLPALGSRGYRNFLMGKPEEAFRDLNQYLAFGERSVAYNNLGIVEAIRRKYDKSIDAFKKAVDTYHTDYNTELYANEDEIAPDIRIATRHNYLTIDGASYLSALRYEIAMVRAFAGDPEFETALHEADEADPNRAPDPQGRSAQDLLASASDGYLLALNWAWQIVRAQQQGGEDAPDDYGVFAAAGALWERMGDIQPRYYDWARQYYEKFETAYKRDPSRQHYAGLARFVAEHLRRTGIHEAEAYHPEPRDPWELAADAGASSANEVGSNPLSYALRQRLLTSAIEILKGESEPQTPARRDLLISLYLHRAQLRVDAGDLKGAREDADRVLSFDSHLSEAYRLRAGAEWEDDSRRQDYERAIAEDRFNAQALGDFADYLEPREPEAALQKMRIRLRLISPGSTDYEQIARLQLKLGQNPEAASSVGTAIAIAPWRPELYQLRFAIESAAGIAEPKARLHLLAGYRAAGDEMARIGNVGRALSMYMRALEGIIALKGPSDQDEDVNFELEASIRGLSQWLVSRYGSHHAVEFWRDVASATAMQRDQVRLLQEARRIEHSP
jgi:hypothetical protein